MKDYIIIERNSVYELMESVNIYLEEGYLLIGGVGVSISKTNTFYYSQAICKPIKQLCQ